MIRYIAARDLPRFAKLHETMFRDRADQFRTRLGWEVSVDSVTGEERDDYDDLNPIYVIWENEDGSHGGSMRILPTTGPTMVNDHFVHLLQGRPIRNDKIWECTRFCLSRGAAPHVSAALLLAGIEFGLGHDLTFSIGVFDARMVRIYGRLGWEPMIMSTEGVGRDAISVGLWSFSESTANKVAERSRIPRAQSRMWYHRVFDLTPSVTQIAKHVRSA
ncbi:MAG: acyl-homoserine-lactone synthase [Pseudomonadota bacterium]